MATLPAHKESLAAGGLQDAYGRRITYARVSLTDRCNFRCTYCMPRQGMPFVAHGNILSYEEMLRICAAMTGLGVTRYKITGGEPLCRKGAAGFIKLLAALPGVREVSLTTNGSLAAPYLAVLAEHGINSITFSLDALDADILKRITRSEVPPGAVTSVMEQAAALDMRVKLNTVPLRGLNDTQLIPLARYALERGWQIRFIELMPVGEGGKLGGIPPQEIFAMLEAEFGKLTKVSYKTGNGPAVMYSLKGHAGLVGFISALSGRFCDSCNRVRLVSTGFFKTCLCHETGVDLRGPLRSGASDAELSNIIKQAVLQKPKGHTFSFSQPGTAGFNMNSVGG